MAEAATSANTTATTTATEAATNENGAQAQEQNTQEQNVLSTEALDKLIQSRVDKSTAELGKKIATLQKENETLKKQNMTVEQIREQEAKDRDKELADRDKALTERENRLISIEKIKEIGLDDGSQLSLELVDFVMAENEEAITARAKAFKSLVDRIVAAKVDETFKANGRVPNGGGKNGEEAKKENSFAAELGKKAAETAKKSNDILKHYYGG